MFSRALTAIAVILASLIAAPALADTSPSAGEILKAIDAVRNPQTAISVVNTLTEFRGGVKQNETVLTIFSKPGDRAGQLRTLVRFDSPARDRGKMMLNDDGQYWYFDPASQASVRLSPQQRLIGQASNGDVMMVNYANDYSGAAPTAEEIADAEGKKQDCWKLVLAPAVPDALYSKIEFWVERQGFRPVRSRFYSDSGRLLKTLYYRNYAMELGKNRPTEVLIVDAVDANLITRIDLSDWKQRDIPDSWFDAAFLPRAGKE